MLTPSKKPALAALGATILSAIIAQSAAGATTTWTGNTTANWSALDGFSTVPLSGDTLSFGAAGSAGTILNNDLYTSASSTVVGPQSTGAIVFSAAAPAYTINGGAFQLGGNSQFAENGYVYNNSANTQTINSNITSLAYNFALANGTVAFGGTNTMANSNVRGGATMIITGTTTNEGAGGSFAGAPILGNNNAGNGTLTVAATGTLNVNGNPNGPGEASMLIGQQTTGGVSNRGTLNLDGGAINVSARTGVHVGNSGGSGTININSGTMTVTGGGAGTFTFNNNGAGSANSTVNLNGGTLATGRAINSGGATAALVLNGGTLKALATQSSLVGTGVTVTTTSANSRIDANGFGVGIARSISGAGGLTIIDSSGLNTGLVTLTGLNTYTGDTSIESGRLSINSAYLSDTGFVDLTTGGSLNLNFVGSDTVSGLVFDGIAQAAGTWGATGSGAQFTNDSFFSGTGTLNVTAVPEPHEYGMVLVGLLFVLVVARRRKMQPAAMG